MTRGRIFVGLGVTAALMLTAGVALAAGRGSGVGPGRPDGAVVATWEGMHEGMQELHASMPEDVREQCEAMHAQMGATMGLGMMGGSGCTMGPGMTGPGMMAR